MSNQTLQKLRREAVARAFTPCADVRAYMTYNGFVQADPIRSPARAEDLILRQRVAGYRAGDILEAYGELALEEAYLYAYGFATGEIWQNVYPQALTSRLTAFEKRVLECVAEQGAVCSDDLDEAVGRRRMRNGWGGQSRASNQALAQLQRRGLVRVAGRRGGVRLYETPEALPGGAAEEERFAQLALNVAALMAPAPRQRLQAILGPVARRLMRGPAVRTASRDVIARFLAAGVLEEAIVDGVAYVWPADEPGSDDVPERVRILAPFDPLVWDRWRFEHLWGWAYRFEAYTPAAKRVRGYYAMPLLWRDNVIGWANAEVNDGVLEVETGFVGAAPGSKVFQRALRAEIARLARFLKLREPGRHVQRD